MKLADRLRPIELILSDVDGVLTDGGITYDNQGIESKTFHVRDGLGIKLWRRAGLKFGIVTGRSSHIVKLRASELELDVLRQGHDDKLPTVIEVINELQIEPQHVCFIGDDLPDLPVMQHVGAAIAVADAVEEVRTAAHYVTSLPGGKGAVREAVTVALQAKSRWDDLLRHYMVG